MWVCVYVCVRVCVCMPECVSACAYASVSAYVSVSASVSACMHMSVRDVRHTSLAFARERLLIEPTTLGHMHKVVHALR